MNKSMGSANEMAWMCKFANHRHLKAADGLPKWLLIVCQIDCLFVGFSSLSCFQLWQSRKAAVYELFGRKLKHSKLLIVRICRLRRGTLFCWLAWHGTPFSSDEIVLYFCSICATFADAPTTGYASDYIAQDENCGETLTCFKLLSLVAKVSNYRCTHHRHRGTC